MIFNSILQYIYNRVFIYQVLTSLTLCSVIYAFIFIKRRRRRHQLLSKYYGIPGQKPSLMWGNYGHFLKVGNNVKVYSDFRQQYGEVFSFFNGDGPNVMIFDPDTLKKIFFDRSDVFTERTRTYLDFPLAHSILFTHYQKWKFTRKVLGPSFHKFNSRNNKSSEFLERSTKLLVESIEHKLMQNSERVNRVTIDCYDLMKACTLHAISSMAIRLPGVEVRENDPNVKSLDEFLSRIDKDLAVFSMIFPFMMGVLSFIAKHFEFSAIMARIDKGVNQTIDDGLKELELNGNQYSKEPQIIDNMIKLHHEGKLNRTEVIGNAEAILLAGYDTSATTLTYALWALAKYPEIQNRLRTELIAHGTECEYLEQVLNETMRLWPVAATFTTRIANQTVKINDLIIPEGTEIIYNNYLMHRDPKLWSEPLKFDPERFAKGAVFHPCAFAPFGLGERKCLGYKLALLEMKMVLCDLLLRFRIHLKSPEFLELTSSAYSLTKPSKKVLLDFEAL